MTSKDSNSGCFVYITLPGATESVTAGRFELKRHRGSHIGRFVYGKSYLQRSDRVEIDPIELKLADTTYETIRLSGLFGALRDAGPDYWGRYVIEKHSGKGVLGELDYLLESPDDRAGALAFGFNQKPPSPLRNFNKTLQLGRLQQIAENLVREQLGDAEHETIQAKELLLLGTSMGGARPKAVVEDDTGLWLAKFSRPDDRWNNPRVEHAVLELARSCGIRAARSRIENVGGKDVLLVQRFDREKTGGGYLRARMISGITLLRAEDSPQTRDRWSYVLMAEELRRVSAEPTKDATELFRRMCFNALISNSDDHPRNHALVAFDQKWALSPAYDLTPVPSSSHETDLALVCGDFGRIANRKNLLSQYSRFLLNKDEASAIISNMTEQIRSTWYSVLRAQGVNERDTEAVKSAFAHDGFEH